MKRCQKWIFNARNNGKSGKFASEFKRRSGKTSPRFVTCKYFFDYLYEFFVLNIFKTWRQWALRELFRGSKKLHNWETSTTKRTQYLHDILPAHLQHNKTLQWLRVLFAISPKIYIYGFWAILRRVRIFPVIMATTKNRKKSPETIRKSINGSCDGRKSQLKIKFKEEEICLKTTEKKLFTDLQSTSRTSSFCCDLFLLHVSHLMPLRKRFSRNEKSIKTFSFCETNCKQFSLLAL